MEARHSSPVTATEIFRTPGEFEGVETRRYREEFVGGGAHYALSGLGFYRNDAIVNAMVVTNADIDPGLAEHFLSSLKSKTESDRAA